MSNKEVFTLISSFYRAVRYTSGIVASICIFLMVCTIVPDSIGRFFFNKPPYGTLELNMLLMSAIVFLGLAWTQSQRGHVRVEILISKTSPNSQRILNIICWTLGFMFFLAITIGGTAEAIHSVMIGENLWGVKKFPLWPGKILAAFGAALLCIQFLVDIGSELVHISSRNAVNGKMMQKRASKQGKEA